MQYRYTFQGNFLHRSVIFSYYEKVGNEVRCIDEEIPFEVPQLDLVSYE